MSTINMALLRGICQLPAYLAFEKGFFKAEGLDVEVEVASTAGLVPQKLASGQTQFAVMPWTRVAAERDCPLVLLAGSGCEEAAIVMRPGITESEIKKVAIPQRGGIKDLTAMGMLKSLGLTEIELIRQPSGDGAIIAFWGQGADAASMVEPYATMLELLGVGRVIRRTGDLWKGAPGCSLTTTASFKQSSPAVVAAVVRAFVRGAEFVRANHEESAAVGSRYIGINSRFILHALSKNGPNLDALRNQKSMDEILVLMRELGYIDTDSSSYLDLSFLDKALEVSNQSCGVTI
jgi:NitT/TauT family transport system substrate-binding protein